MKLKRLVSHVPDAASNVSEEKPIPNLLQAKYDNSNAEKMIFAKAKISEKAETAHVSPMMAFGPPQQNMMTQVVPTPKQSTLFPTPSDY